MKNISLFFTTVFLLVSLNTSEARSLREELFDQTSAHHQSYSYSEARKELFNNIYLSSDSRGFYIEGVYCEDKHYPFGGANPNNRLPDHTVFNTEHTWPQSKFSRRFPSGIQKTDLHHLFPTYSRINSERGNLPFAEVNAQRDLFCDESDMGNSVNGDRGPFFEPPNSHKGNVARAMFYFSVRYQMAIDAVQEKYLRLWHREDPVDEAERQRHEKIFKLQRNRNPFIDNPALVDQIENF